MLRLPRIELGSVRLFRALFAALLVLSVLRFFAYGWIAQFYLEPRFFFAYVPWIKPHAWMHAHYAIMAVAAVGIATGVAYRASVAVFFIAFTYAELIDKTYYLNHYYFVSLVLALLLVLPKPAETMPAYAVWLLRAQIACVYIFAGIAKLNADWLFNAAPLRFWLARQGGWLEATWLAYAASWAGAAFDLCVVPALLIRKTRPFAFAAVVVFHVSTALLFNIGLFPWLMIVSATLFFDGQETTSVRIPRWVSAFACAFVVMQLVLPRDDRFQWRVMLKERSGVADFIIIDKTGRRYEVLASEELSALQARQMAMQTDMIKQYGQHLADVYRARGVDVAEVRVRSLLATNGHPAEPLLPPDVNLLSYE